MHTYKPAQPAFTGWALAEARDKKVKGNLIKNLQCCAEAIPGYLPRVPSVACYTEINNAIERCCGKQDTSALIPRVVLSPLCPRP